MAVRHDGSEVELTHEHEGIWVGVVPVAEVPTTGCSSATTEEPFEIDDPYRFLPTLGEVDLHLINEGRHEQLWEVLGAHVEHYEGGVSGTSFAVWAPHARGIRLKASFNNWDGREHPMRQLGTSGVWELFVPDIGSGTGYKFSILGADEQWREGRPDGVPHGGPAGHVVGGLRVVVHLERRPVDGRPRRTAAPRRGHVGLRDASRLVEEAPRRRHVHLRGGGRQPGRLRHRPRLHPCRVHAGHGAPFGGSWGYQITSRFAPTARFGDDGLRYLIDRLHQAGSASSSTGCPHPQGRVRAGPLRRHPLYEDPDPSRGEHPDWGTLVFNFGRREVRFLVANALYWLEEFHVDGLRVDAASMLYLDYSREPGEWTPNVHGGRENLEAVQFLQEMNATVYKRVPGAITVAEESTSWEGVTRPTSEGGLGFGLKWNMGWMHDTLGYLEHDPVYRSYHHGEMTFSLVYAFSENYTLPISHDEVVHGKGSLLRKMPGDRWQQLANLRAYLGYMWAHPASS